MSVYRYTKAQVADSIAALKSLLAQDARIYAIQRHKAQSGLSVFLSVLTFNKEGDPIYVTNLIAAVLSESRTDKKGDDTIIFRNPVVDPLEQIREGLCKTLRLKELKATYL